MAISTDVEWGGGGGGDGEKTRTYLPQFSHTILWSSLLKQKRKKSFFWSREIAAVSTALTCLAVCLWRQGNFQRLACVAQVPIRHVLVVFVSSLAKGELTNRVPERRRTELCCIATHETTVLSQISFRLRLASPLAIKVLKIQLFCTESSGQASSGNVIYEHPFCQQMWWKYHR